MSIHIIVTPDGVDLVTILQQIAAQGTETLSRLETLMKTAADFEVELGQLKDALVAANGAKDAALAAAQAAEKTAEDNLVAAQAAEKKAEDAAAALQAQVDAGVIPDNIAQEVQDIITSLTTPTTTTTTGTTGATSVTNPDGSVTTTNPDGATTTTPPPAEAPVP